MMGSEYCVSLFVVFGKQGCIAFCTVCNVPIRAKYVTVLSIYQKFPAAMQNWLIPTVQRIVSSHSQFETLRLRKGNVARSSAKSFQLIRVSNLQHYTHQSTKWVYHGQMAQVPVNSGLKQETTDHRYPSQLARKPGRVALSAG